MPETYTLSVEPDDEKLSIASIPELRGELWMLMGKELSVISAGIINFPPALRRALVWLSHQQAVPVVGALMSAAEVCPSYFYRVWGIHVGIQPSLFLQRLRGSRGAE